MNDELKNYRAPRSPWPKILSAAVAVAFLGIVGPMDLADQMNTHAENFLLKVELERLRKPQAEIAPIRPKRGGAKCATWIAKQPDGQKWTMLCAPAADLRGVKS